MKQSFDFQVAQGASVPSLGLSNKAVDFTGDKAPPNKSEKDRHVKDMVKVRNFEQSNTLGN